jgi:hypothetical protein
VLSAEDAGVGQWETPESPGRFDSTAQSWKRKKEREWFVNDPRKGQEGLALHMGPPQRPESGMCAAEGTRPRERQEPMAPSTTQRPAGVWDLLSQFVFPWVCFREGLSGVCLREPADCCCRTEATCPYLALGAGQSVLLAFPVPQIFCRKNGRATHSKAAQAAPCAKSFGTNLPVPLWLHRGLLSLL